MASLRIKLLFTAGVLALLLHRWWLPPTILLYNLAMLPVRWSAASAQSLISEEKNHFDVTFQSYPIDQQTAGSGYEDVVPAILHHINLGSNPPRTEWLTARENCLQHHEGWQSFLWDDATADSFVQENFPQLKSMWDNYRYRVQRVDALRYMVLYKYGGAVLDFDLSCKRSMGPLRRFNFVAPAAHPTGFSIGMMLARPNDTFVGEIINGLQPYNRAWLFLPYVTVMFSTGCHFASTLFTLFRERSSTHILVGPSSNPKMHMLNGLVDTPLFKHLGSSSWHSFDALMINSLGHTHKGPLVFVLIAVSFIMGSLIACWCTSRLWRRRRKKSQFTYQLL